MKIIRRVLSKVGRLLCRHRGNQLIEAFVWHVSAFLRDLNNSNWDMSKNGELRVIECLEIASPLKIFDVGANVGEWSMLISKVYPKCEVHSFEIIPSTCENLIVKTRSMPNIIVNNVGLSDRSGAVTMSISKRDSSVATACRIEGMRFHDDYYSSEMECNVTTGAQYVEDHEIKFIDFLKIDVEGMDLKVLRGFGDKLFLVKIIQFEYGIFNIASHDLLSDYFILLQRYGFVVGKVYPNKVHFFEYHFSYEDFGGNNYIAVKSSETALIKRLSAII